MHMNDTCTYASRHHHTHIGACMLAGSARSLLESTGIVWPRKVSCTEVSRLSTMHSDPRDEFPAALRAFET